MNELDKGQTQPLLQQQQNRKSQSHAAVTVTNEREQQQNKCFYFKDDIKEYPNYEQQLERISIEGSTKDQDIYQKVVDEVKKNSVKSALRYSNALKQNYEDDQFEKDKKHYFKSKEVPDMYKDPKQNVPEEQERTYYQKYINDVQIKQKEDTSQGSIKIDRVKQDIIENETKFMEEISQSGHNKNIGNKTLSNFSEYGPFMKPLYDKKESRTHLDQVIVEEILEVENQQSRKPPSQPKLHHFIINKIYDHQNKAMFLQIIKVLEGNKAAKLVKLIRIQSIFHLFGLATLDINPEYISYAQNGRKLYYWVQKMDNDSSKNNKNQIKIQLMELDLLDLTETPKKDHCREVDKYIDKNQSNNRRKEFRGTLMAAIFLPKHVEKINLSKEQKFEDFCEDQLILFLYKSNLSRTSAQYSGDSFQIFKLSQMNQNDKPLYDSVEKVVFSQEIQSMGPIFLRIPANKQFKFKENEFEFKDEIIYLSFVAPDDDDDVGGLFKDSHTKAKSSIHQKPGKDTYCVLKVKTGDEGEINQIDDIGNDDDLKKSKEQQKADREKVVGTLESWSKYLKSQGNPRSSIVMERDVNSGDLNITRNFCQINKILQHNDCEGQISVLLDTTRQIVDLVRIKQNGFFLHQHIIMKKDDHETSKSREELSGLNRMLFEIFSKESYRVNYCVDTNFDNMISYHNDTESKITIGKFEELEKKGHGCKNYNKQWKCTLGRYVNEKYDNFDQLSCRLVSHKSENFFDKKDGIEQNKSKFTFLYQNLEMRSKNTSYIFKMLSKGKSDASDYKFISRKKVEHNKVKITENPLMVVPERVTFSKDDRQFRPFILIKTESDDYQQVSKVTKVWVAIINIETCDIEHINEQRIMGEVKVNYKNVQKYFKFVQSSDPSTGKDKDNSKYLEQHYQLMIKYENLDFAVVREIRTRWHFKNENESQIDYAYSRNVGQKFLAAQGKHNIDKSEIFPMFGDKNQILGTQLFTGKGDDTHSIQITNLVKSDDFKYPNQIQNYSNYRKFPLHDECEIILFEVGLSEMIKSHLWSRRGLNRGSKNNYFSQYDVNEILDNSMRTVMNLVPKDFVGLISRDNIQDYSYFGYSLESPLEILGGQTILSKTIKNPQILEQLLDSKDLSYEKQAFTKSLIQRYILRDNQQKFMDENHLLYNRQEPEMAIGIDNIPLLRQILYSKEPTQIRLITENLFQNGNLSRYEFIMSSLMDAEDSENFEYFFPFFECSLQVEDKKAGDKTGLLNFDQHISNPKFQKFINPKRKIVPYVNLAGDFNQETIYEEVMKEQAKEAKFMLENPDEANDNEAEISFIDFRPLLLEYKLQAMIAKDKIADDMKIVMNHFELARFIDSIFAENKYPLGEIDNQKIMRTIISYQFNEYAKPYYKYMCAIFLFGFFLPLMAQILFEIPRSATIITSVIFLATQVFLFYIETIQMKTLTLEKYFSIKQNWLECIMFPISAYYSIRKILEPEERFFANHSEVFKQDKDIATEIIISGTFLVFMSMVKLLNLLKSYDLFGNFVYMVIKCIESTLVFCIFLGSWVFIFTILLMVIGGQFDDGDYPGLTLRTRTMIQVYRNSIGDIAAPKYNLWYDEKDEQYTKGTSGKIMVYLIWIVWFLNQFFCMIMLLNFLIAIISEEYAQINTYATHFLYTRRKELNYDSLTVYNHFNKLKDFNTLIVWSNPESVDAIGTRDVASVIKQFVGQSSDTFYIDLRQQFLEQKEALLKSLSDVRKSIAETSKDKSSNGEGDSLLNEYTDRLKEDITKKISNQKVQVDEDLKQVQKNLEQYSEDSKKLKDSTQDLKQKMESMKGKNQKELGQLQEDIIKEVDSFFAEYEKTEIQKVKQEKVLQEVKNKAETNATTFALIKQSVDIQQENIKIAEVNSGELLQEVKNLEENTKKQVQKIQETIESNFTIDKLNDLLKKVENEG